MYKVMIVDDEPIIVEGLSRRFTRILCLWISACRRWTDWR